MVGERRVAQVSVQPERKPKNARPSWTLDDVPWERFDASRVEPGLLKALKGACMVEHHSDDYVTYLCSVFHDDPGFQADARAWGIEEVRHGQALRRWCELADPSFDFETSFARFSAGHRLPTRAVESVRGSRAKELVARCFVESGTSAFYSAVRDATEEPVLRHICHRIAGDEYRHYRLFYSNKKRYGAIEKPSIWAGLRVALGRLTESGDDELAYAYYCGNGLTAPYRRRRYAAAFARRTLPLYRYEHVAKGLAMILKAAGLKPRSWSGRWLTRIGWLAFRTYAWSLSRVGT